MGSTPRRDLAAVTQAGAGNPQQPARRHHLAFGMTLVLMSLATGAAQADTVYRCVGADGVVSFQDHSCLHHEGQTVLHLRDVIPAPAATVAGAAAAVDTPSPVAQPAAAPSAPLRPSLPALYACLSAVNGNTYVSRTGDPPPYTVPLGISGYIQQPLGLAYGTGTGTHLSAPEAGQPPVSLGYAPGYSIWVQDACRLLSRDETCSELQREANAIKAKLQYAFGDDREPLLQRAAQLEAELAACR